MYSAFIIPGMSGPFEVLLILMVILLLFGAKRLPDLARSLGRSLSEFKRGREEGAGAELDAAKQDTIEGTDDEKPASS
jgi:sec-independent protein translocase protein TatA